MFLHWGFLLVRIKHVYLSKLKRMKYLVTEVFSNEYFITEETTIDDLVTEMYSEEGEDFDLEESKKVFFSCYDVFEIRGELVKIN